MLKITSANIRFDNPGDKGQRWAARMPLLTELINSYSTDLLGTQEGREPQLREFSRTLTKLEISESHRDWIEERMYPCIFFNADTLSIEKSGDIWLSETPTIPGSKSFGSAFPRLCTWAIFEIRKSSERILVVNTHLDHVLMETREKQTEVLITEISKINKNNHPLIIMGDFNAGPDSPVREKLINAPFELVDHWIEKNETEESTFHKFRGKLSHEDGGNRIDWILVNKKFQCEEVIIDKFKKDTVWPSDHFPVKLEISW